MPPYLNAKNIEITSLRFLRLCLWAFWLIPNNKNEKSSDTIFVTIQNIMRWINILLMLHAFLKQMYLSTRTMQNLEWEIEYSRKNLQFFPESTTALNFIRAKKRNKHILETATKGNDLLDFKYGGIEPIQNEPYSWIFKLNQSKVKINKGDDRLYLDVQKWHKLLAKFEAAHPQEYQLLVRENDMPDKLTYLSFSQKYITPFGYQNDWMAKIRMADQQGFGILSACIVFFIFSDNKNSVTDPKMNCLLLFSALVFCLLAYRENFLMKEEELKYNLQGIQKRLTPYHKFPPMCIGQQITAQRFFVGRNRNLEDSVSFLEDIVKMMDKAPSIPGSVVWNEMQELRIEMRNYFSVVDEIDNEKNLNPSAPAVL